MALMEWTGNMLGVVAPPAALVFSEIDTSAEASNVRLSCSETVYSRSSHGAVSRAAVVTCRVTLLSEFAFNDRRVRSFRPAYAEAGSLK